MTTIAASDGDDDLPRLSDEQRAAIVRTISTPAFMASLEQVQEQVRSVTQQSFKPVARALAVQLEPVLKASRLQTSTSEIVRRSMERQQLDTKKMLEPVLAQITAQQRQWAERLAVPLMGIAQLQVQTATRLVSPELNAALQKISEAARVHLEFPNLEGFDRLSELIESGEIDATAVEEAEAGLRSEDSLQPALDEAADALVCARPWMTRKLARRVVVVWVWAMWAAVLVCIATGAPSIVGAVIAASGLPGSVGAAKWVGGKFDERFPPEGDTDGD